jgi:hypothetical protein
MRKEKLRGTKAHQRYYTTDGKQVPGATTVLGVLNKPALVHWAWKLGMDGVDYKKFRDKAADIGTCAHYMVECEFKGEEPDLSLYSPDVVDKAENALIKFWDWRKEHDVQPIMSEAQMVSDKYLYGGTIDCYAMVDGAKTLLDIKTGKGIYDEHFHQLAAYERLLSESEYDVANVRILRIGRSEDEGFEEQVVSKERLVPHWNIFSSCIDIYYAQKCIKEGM